ncbi:MAG TPA: hypothetical protein VE889_07180, partial [Actinomycetota bacterium]|nr:hypothetical protein [Actinomycetota bacterium]
MTGRTTIGSGPGNLGCRGGPRTHRGIRTERSTEGSHRGRIAGAGQVTAPLVPGDARASDRLGNGSWEIEPSLDETEFDSIEEVDAVARSLRRVAIEYGTAITALLLVVPLL